MVDVGGSVHHLQTAETFVFESFSLLIAGSAEFHWSCWQLLEIQFGLLPS